ncbi:MAG: hypothetical protein R3B45_07215 [Bdellovibrionota bacterium]
MNEGSKLIAELSDSYQEHFRQQKVILSFGHFLEIVKNSPSRYIRNAASYTADAFKHFGTRPSDPEDPQSPIRFKVFDLGTEKNGPIIGGEFVQQELRNILSSFERTGFSSKLILLHGPNGSAKTSTVETIARAMQVYSTCDEGAVYKFNWIFPADKSAGPIRRGEPGPIGFAKELDDPNRAGGSYALLDEAKVASKIASEFKENPIFLIPEQQRLEWLKKWIAEEKDCHPEEVNIPPHMMLPGLSKRNQEIFENLLNAYSGNLVEVFRHVQVERFFYSRQYHVGISTVEPQMSIDAREKQLTLDKNISNLPSVLNTINFYLSEGELIEANRGLLEFSDLLKRPAEAFKYLLSTIEKSAINLPSGTANLDIVFIGTTNEKHLDAFKTTPDFGSFKGRFELITVPYLLRPSEEVKIYKSDIEALKKTIKIAPHSLRFLCTWAVMTRFKQPEPEFYERVHRALISKLDPRSKAKLYDKENLHPLFNNGEQKTFNHLRTKIMSESRGMVVYEGRFGASPREVRAILHKAAQNTKYKTLTPMAIFNELRELAKDRTVYEFLQFEPRGKYHNIPEFINTLESEFIALFQNECVAAMDLVETGEYENLVKRYIENVVAEIKKEKIWDTATNSHVPPSKAIMEEVEKIIDIKIAPAKHRENLLSRIASYKIDNPDLPTDVMIIFDDIMQKLKDHFFKEKRQSLTPSIDPCFLSRKKTMPLASAKYNKHKKHLTT